MQCIDRTLSAELDLVTITKAGLFGVAALADVAPLEAVF